ncbi:MAG: xanthine dehydrogenase accessory protein XdhC [Beijerinckiaceae bacterium]|nr:xanthine dehydrogenase accessory protein XdhC [Beijerinckiaceae bacterium]MCZ8300990.1 xanthine dehydrogenase accessory protein XdhC [Beijerinckiaceae bacterium]
MADWARIAATLAEDGQLALVTIDAVRGSSPREAGTRMMVRADGRIAGTIGGGTLEWQAIALAQQAMARHPEGHGQTRGFALGPDMGQCCGGHVTLRIEALARADLAWLEKLVAALRQDPARPVTARPDPRGILLREARDAALPVPDGAVLETPAERPQPLLLFGAGHVGRALILALAPLPFAIRWIDTRRELFPGHRPANAVAVATADPVAEIAAAPRGAFILAMTHSHALDLDLMAAALARPDLPYCGVIGSATKRARFASQLTRQGLPAPAIERMICPVGVKDLGSKHPAVIAAGITVELLRHKATLALARPGATVRAQAARG